MIATRISGTEIALFQTEDTRFAWNHRMMPSKSTVLLCLTALSVLVAGAVFMRIGAPQVRGTWEYEVFTSGLSKVDNIVIAPDRSLYVSLELPDGQGQVMQLQRGKRNVVLKGLRRPDGLTLSSTSLFVTEEVERGRIVKLDLESLESELVARLNKPEGIKRLPDGSLIVAEDSTTEGRLVTVTMSGQVDLFVDGLSKPEGVALGRDGSVYVAESEKGRILSVSPWGIRTVVKGLNSPDQIAIAPDGAIWITEDEEAGRVLRFFEGKLETVLAGMSKPQGIAIDDAGWIYIAEQGRDRIVRLRRS